jgi:soluble lytic murein transglycosylase-like protein
MAASPETMIPRRTATTVRTDRSGRLVRAVVAPTPTLKLAKPDPQVAQIVEETAKTHKVDPALVHSVIKVESNYNPYAISPKGAEGLMQLIPSTAKRFGVSNSFDPKQNIEAGVKYLKYLQELFGDDRLALAAYNAGEGAVQKYKWIPPYRETQDYVQKVTEKYQAARASQPASPKVAEDTKAEAKPSQPAEEYGKLEAWVDPQGRLHMRTVAPK